MWLWWPRTRTRRLLWLYYSSRWYQKSIISCVHGSCVDDNVASAYTIHSGFGLRSGRMEASKRKQMVHLLSITCTWVQLSSMPGTIQCQYDYTESDSVNCHFILKGVSRFVNYKQSSMAINLLILCWTGNDSGSKSFKILVGHSSPLNFEMDGIETQ